MLGLYYCETALFECEMIKHCDGKTPSKAKPVRELRAEAVAPKEDEPDIEKQKKALQSSHILPSTSDSSSSKFGSNHSKKLDVDALISSLQAVRKSRGEDFIIAKDTQSGIAPRNEQAVPPTPELEPWSQGCDGLDFLRDGIPHTWRLI